MAGVVAMASVIEDFDTQPCKKSRKDGGSPVVKTITNYFSPVPKPVEKPFSPPRSNNIRDYFSRKAPSSKEKTSSPEQSKENCQTSQTLAEKHASADAAVKPASQKLRRKTSKAARKLLEAETVSSTEDCLIVDEPHDVRDSAAEAVSSCGVLGSDTAVLMAQLTAEACITEGNSERNSSKTVRVEQTEEDASKCGKGVRLNPGLNGIELSPIVPSKDKAKKVKTVAGNSRKAKHSEPEEEENCQTSQTLAEKHASADAAVKPPSQKRRKKTSKAARKLLEAETVSSTEDCVIVEEPHDGRDSAAEAVSSCGVLGSDTAVLMAQLTAEACITEGNSERNSSKTVRVEQAEEDASKCGKGVRLNPELNGIELSPIIPSKDKAKKVKTVAGNSRKAKHSEPEEEEKESSLYDVSMEVNVDEASQLNNSTVTISFEDFVRSQSQGEDEDDVEDVQDKEDERKITEEMDTDQLDIPKAEENIGSGESPFQISPRTVTIQAEVHVVSPKQEAAMAGGKLASIFNRRKGAMSPAEVASSPHVEAGHHLTSTSLNVKRKSNVVLQEEDLELAVLESESVPRCSEVERKQFMSAFKQPSLDGSKTKPGKSQGKPKQPGALGDADKAAEEDAVSPPSVEEVPAASQESKVAKKKPARKGRKKAKEEKEAVATPAPTPAAAAEETVVVEVDKREEPPITSTPSIPAARRSRREAVVRQAPEATPATPIRETRRRNKSKDAAAAAAAASPDDGVAEMTTPKMRRSKRRVFVAEMVSPTEGKESPIRIKFTRVHKNVSLTKAESGSCLNTSFAAKTSNDSKKRRQAKKLVEKAKVIQQSKKTAVKEKGTLRRSSRTEMSTKKSYCEDEDSVICLGEDQTAPEKSKTQKPLRTLNEVLGKASSVGKESKTVPGSKGGKMSGVISIFDDSSSENSQDDEQFKARREFLKSGLPETFRKQIAKTAANKEAFSLSCSSFQPVIHMSQPSNDCPLWSLLWPESSLLRHLKEVWCQTSSSPPPVSGSLCVKTEPARRAFCERGSGFRPEISESVSRLLLEEVNTSNPPFPVQMFITRFLKRRAEHQQQSVASEPEAVTSTTLPAEPVGWKRKRTDEDGEMTVKVAKKQRGSCAEEEKDPEPEPTRRGGRTRRARRSRPEEKDQPSVKPAPIPSEDDSVVVIGDLLLGENAGKKDVVKEDVLWTDKYQPQHSSDILGNTASVRRLHSWLKEWKLRTDREERKKQKDKKQEEGSNDSDWDCGEEDSQDGEDMLCNTMLITGPTGVGKTAAVYACAQELGFKVFEVNASSQRSGRLILSQLKEATQSHQVDSQGVNAHKPTYFNSYGTSSSAGALKPGSSPRKVNSPRRVVSSPRKHPQSPRGAKRGGLAPTSLANFFKMGPPAAKETPNTKKNEQTAASKKVVKANECANKQKDPAVKSQTAKEKNNEDQSKKTATSLILFEEVDVIFEDDSGFLAAIKTFMTTTKRPVILTTSDPAFSTMFDGNFEEILFKTPSVLDVSSFLQLLCLSEDVRTDLLDISSLLRLNGCDIRQSLLQLQFWTRSAGGHDVTRPLMHTGKNAELKPEADEEKAGTSMCAATVPSSLPPCDTGCTQSMLGLLNVEPERDIWELLKSQSPVEETLCWELLTNSKRRGVDLLYSNMETLLALPLTLLTIPTYKPEQSVSASQDPPSINPTELPSHATLLHAAESADCSDDGSPVKMSNRMRKNKKRHHLPDQDGLDSDSDDGFLSLCKPQGAPPQAKEEVKERIVSETARRKPLTPEERVKSLPVSQCLEAIADFFDNMSYMDSSLLVHPQGGDNHRRMSPVGAVVKDGMTDESRVETDRGSWVRGGHILEIPAAVEGLSFHKCRVSVAEAWSKAQQLEGELGKEAAAELTLPVAAHRQGYSFTQDGPCQPQLVQRRREVMESLMFRGVFGTLGNRPAAALDYLPALRNICRSEQLKEQGKVKRRFLHYLDSIQLGLDKSTLQHLAEDFP